MTWEARAKLTAASDQLISALTEPAITVELQAFCQAIDRLDDLLEEMNLDRSTRMNAIVGATARSLLEKYGGG